MYRTGKAVRSLLPLTPLVTTERFSSWLIRSSLPPSLLCSVGVFTPSCVSQLRRFSSAPPPPPAAPEESYLSGTSGAYVEEMYEAWAYDPKSVHSSWDAYFRGSAYQAPPFLGHDTRPNEVSLASIMPGLATPAGQPSGQASTAVIDAHLAVQGTIRSYQVRGHLAAQIDPLGLNNMDREQAKKMIIRSVTVDEKVPEFDLYYLE